MIESTWGRWFVNEEIEAAAVDTISLWFLGITGFVIRSPTTTIYIDPYFSTERERRYVARMPPVPMDPAWVTDCGGVLCTHDHLDHFHPPSFEPLLDGGGELYAPAACLQDSNIGSIARNRRHTVEPGETYDIGDLTVHVRGGRDPDANGSVTYVIEHDTWTLFHGGDNRPCNAFDAIGREFDIDLGTLAFGTVARLRNGNGEVVRRQLYNSADDVVEAANALGIDRLVPTHWRRWRCIQADPNALRAAATSWKYPHVAETIEVGDRLDVDRPGIVPAAHLED